MFNALYFLQRPSCITNVLKSGAGPEVNIHDKPKSRHIIANLSTVACDWYNPQRISGVIYTKSHRAVLLTNKYTRKCNLYKGSGNILLCKQGWGFTVTQRDSHTLVKYVDLVKIWSS